MKAKFVKSVLFLSMLSLGGNLLAQEPNQGASQEQTWTVNFKDTDILEVVKFIGEVTGKTIIVDPKVRGPIKVISNKQLNKRELYELFLAVLDVHGFTAVESAGVVRVVANRDARNLPIPTEEAVKSKDDGYITQIIQLNNISAAKVLAALRPLVPQYGHLSAYEPSNALIISDTRANIWRINELIAQMDKGAVIGTDVLQLHYAQATEVVNMVNQLEKPDPNRGATTAPPIIVADKRTNAVVVSGDEMSRQRIKGVVDNLDRPQAKNSNVRVVYLRYGKAADVAKVLTGMLQSQGQGKAGDAAAATGGQANVQADEATNSVLITADSDTMQSMLAIVESLDIRRAQVLVEAIIVEIENGNKKNLGVQWMYADTQNGFAGSRQDDSLPGLGKAAFGLKSDDQSVRDTSLGELAAGLAQGQTLGFARLGDRTSFMGILQALQSDSGTNILSTPNLLTTDNTKAKISVGQKVPFKTGSYTSTGTGNSNSGISSPFSTINREDVGILLEVTPHINEGNSIVLDIKQEVSSISNTNSPDGLITNQRKIDTQILAGDGQTVVLGGLIQDKATTDATRVPLLGSIPLVGNLFRTKGTTKGKTNLLVFIRASVIRDDETLTGATAEKYKAIRDVQLEARRVQGELINPKSIPVLPEWKDPQTKVEGPTAVVPGTAVRSESVPAEPAAAAPAPVEGQ